MPFSIRCSQSCPPKVTDVNGHNRTAISKQIAENSVLWKANKTILDEEKQRNDARCGINSNCMPGLQQTLELWGYLFQSSPNLDGKTFQWEPLPLLGRTLLRIQ